MKRLRFRFGDGIRFFHCGEYGENFGRPHYHACLFNFDFKDRVLWSERQGVRLYTSEALAELWPFGFSTVGDVTFESAAYVARYVLKKVTGEEAFDHYRYVDEITGQIFERAPEYVTMSRRPGIGRGWIEEFASDVYPGDFVVIAGRMVKTPRYYDQVYDLSLESHSREVKWKRKRLARKNACDNTDRRLHVKEEVKSSVVQLLKRSL